MVQLDRIAVAIFPLFSSPLTVENPVEQELEVHGNELSLPLEAGGSHSDTGVLAIRCLSRHFPWVTGNSSSADHIRLF